MSIDIVNQITIDCLLNKAIYNNHFRSKKNQQKIEDIKFYKKRTLNLFKDIISDNIPENLLLDVKYAYDNFINSTVQYFKTIDKNDIIQATHIDDIDNPIHICSNIMTDVSYNINSNIEADELFLRSIKFKPTLDKYVIRNKIKKSQDNIILPEQREINLKSYDLKTKGLKKNNIINIYEDKN
jgi:hypothetical protein